MSLVSQHTFWVSTVDKAHRAWATFLDGYFAYGVFDGDMLVTGAGLDRDQHAITSIDQLVIESHGVIDWHSSIGVLRKLRRIEVDRYDTDTKAILEKVFVKHLSLLRGSCRPWLTARR